MRAGVHFIFAFFIIISLASCFGGGNFATAEEEAEDLRGTSWILDEKRDFQPTISFDEKLSKVSGNTGCNSYNADFILKNYSFRINSFMSTEMYCDALNEDEQDYYLRLSESVEFRIMKQNILFLKNGRGRVLLRFRKKE